MINMKHIIKRNGKAVAFDENKIRTAIQKANKEMALRDACTGTEIEQIVLGVKTTDGIESVEDVQDYIETKLMEFGKTELAKKYIKYRYQRTLVRKTNELDDNILSLIKNENKELAEENSNKNAMLASTQRDYVAGEVSKDLTKRVLLPE